MFLGIGHIPNAQAFSGMMDLDEDGYIVAQDDVYCTLNGKSSPASSPAATSKTASTARPSPPPAPAAWLPSRSRSTWKVTAADPAQFNSEHATDSETA